MANSRVSRGRASQALVAAYLAERGWPDAKSRAASLPGKDIYDAGALAPEMKATAKADFTGAMRQAKANAKGDELPFVIYRPHGYGPEKIGQWLVVFDLETAVNLLRSAGYALEA